MAKTMRKPNKKSRRPRRQNGRKTRRMRMRKGGLDTAKPSFFSGVSRLFSPPPTKVPTPVKPKKYIPKDSDYEVIGFLGRDLYSQTIKEYLSEQGIDDLGSTESNQARLKTIIEILNVTLSHDKLRKDMSDFQSKHGFVDTQDFYKTRIGNKLSGIQSLIQKCEGRQGGLTPERIERIKKESNSKFSSKCE